MMDPTAPTIVLGMVQGSFEFVDSDGKRVAYDNWQTLLKLYLDHCAKIGVKPRDVASW
jgi:hypothetical protein